MGRIPENIISEVMDRADMLQIVGDYVQLKRAGTRYKGLCPFHSEKTPSFTVNPGSGFFKCFGCGEGGTVYTFLMKAEGWSFPEAVRNVAGRVGIEVPELNNEDAEKARSRRKAREQYQKLLGSAQSWFESNLWGEGGEVPRAYLKSRGVDEDAVRAFGLGFAPEGWSGLVDHLKRQKLNLRGAVDAGLLAEGSRGPYDRFRDRIIFPVVDIWGKVVAFGGRRLNDDPDAKVGAKYINSPETAFYTKGSELYGLAATKRAVRSEGWALLVEGNFDVVVLYARGVQNAVAPMGTALTERQARLLSRYTQRVNVAFDGDKAGHEATLRSLPILLKQKLDARVVTMPPGDDPDSLIQREGQQALQDAIDKARPIVAHALDRIIEPALGAPIEERVAALRKSAEVMSHVDDRVTWKHYAEELGRKLDIPVRDIDSYLRHPKKKNRQAPKPTRKAQPKPQQQRKPTRPQERKPHSQPASQPPPGPGFASLDGPPVGAAPPPWERGDMGPPLDDMPMAAGPPPDFDPNADFVPNADFAPSNSFEPEANEEEHHDHGDQPIPKLEAHCFQILADLPERLKEFVSEGCCQLMTDERLANLIERVCERHVRTEKPPEYALLAEQIAEEFGDRSFFGQISALLCAERAYNEEKIEQTYLDTITKLQERWLHEEYKKVDRLLGAMANDPVAALEVLKKKRDLDKLRSELDVHLQRKRL